jgi:hypothetical protein
MLTCGILGWFHGACRVLKNTGGYPRGCRGTHGRPSGVLGWSMTGYVGEMRLCVCPSHADLVADGRADRQSYGTADGGTDDADPYGRADRQSYGTADGGTDDADPYGRADRQSYGTADDDADPYGRADRQSYGTADGGTDDADDLLVDLIADPIANADAHPIADTYADTIFDA